MPLAFDMPMDKLKKYRGRNPKPADFDRFWDKSLAEMRAIDPKIELRPAKFKTPFADCFNMYFTGVGGARIHAKLLRPKHAPAKPAPGLVMFHGYTGNSGEWMDKLGYVAMGYTVAALDCRGQGGLSEDSGSVVGNTFRGHIIRGIDGPAAGMTFRAIYLDTAQLAGIVMDMEGVDPKRVGALGGSQGGGLTLACASLEPRIKLVAPVFPFLCDFQRTWEIDLAKDAYQEIKDYFRLFDPHHDREKEIFTKLGYIDVQHLTRRIKGEVRMTVGLQDTVCPPSTQFAAYNKIKARKHLVIYPDFGHEGLPGNNDGTFEFMCGL